MDGQKKQAAILSHAPVRILLPIWTLCQLLPLMPHGIMVTLRYEMTHTKGKIHNADPLRTKSPDTNDGSVKSVSGLENVILRLQRQSARPRPGKY
jgi:hypothetical protein